MRDPFEPGESLARPPVLLRPRCLRRVEDLLDQAVEEVRDLERERKARVVLAGLERVDGLTGDAEPIREVRLRPVALRAQDPERVLHR